VRLTTFGSDGVIASREFAVPASTHLYRKIRVTDTASATEVEYFGGWVGAGWVVQRGGSEPALAASRCAPSPSPSWYAPDVPTGRGQTALLVVMNPFAEDATFDVVLRTDQRTAVSPTALSPYVLPAGTSIAVRVNQYLLQSPREAIVTGEVHVRLGRVVAGSLSLSADGVGAEVGVPSPAHRWVLPAAAYEGGTTANLMQAQNRGVDLTVLAQGPTEERVLTEGPGALPLGPHQVLAYGVEDPSALGLVVEAASRGQVAAQRRVTGEGGDPALIGGSPVSRPRWLLLPSLPPKGGRTTMVVENPGRATAAIRLQLFGSDGPVPAGIFERFTVSPGRSLTLDLGRVVGNEPVSALLTTTEGTIVVGEASYGSNDAGYAATLGLPARQGV
jgi:hypothetical protein